MNIFLIDLSIFTEILNCGPCTLVLPTVPPLTYIHFIRWFLTISSNTLSGQVAPYIVPSCQRQIELRKQTIITETIKQNWRISTFILYMKSDFIKKICWNCVIFQLAHPPVTSTYLEINPKSKSYCV